ncbi:MAG TPA: hypothetical protein VFA26_02190 [Gemmataceae bacterium]|nr:hypothetical protein [Gemmataceae bacterium]
MNPLKMSAQFAAYVWHAEARQGSATPDESARFARENWVAFLPCAHEGWGRLLIRIAKPPRRVGVRRMLRRATKRAAERPIEGMAEAG